MNPLFSKFFYYMPLVFTMLWFPALLWRSHNTKKQYSAETSNSKVLPIGGVPIYSSFDMMLRGFGCLLFGIVLVVFLYDQRNSGRLYSWITYLCYFSCLGFFIDSLFALRRLRKGLPPYEYIKFEEKFLHIGCPAWDLALDWDSIQSTEQHLAKFSQGVKIFLKKDLSYDEGHRAYKVLTKSGFFLSNVDSVESYLHHSKKYFNCDFFLRNSWCDGHIGFVQMSIQLFLSDPSKRYLLRTRNYQISGEVRGAVKNGHQRKQTA